MAISRTFTKGQAVKFGSFNISIHCEARWLFFTWSEVYLGTFNLYQTTWIKRGRFRDTMVTDQKLIGCINAVVRGGK